MPQVKLDEQVTKTIAALDKAWASIAASLRGTSQPLWADLSTKVDSRKNLLEAMTRKDINSEYTNRFSDLTKVTLAEMMALETQNDFLGAIARDWYHLRRSRINRFLESVPMYEGMTGSTGVLQAVVLQYMKNLTETGQ